ncbi:MAG: hypothetical protein PHS73_04340, partial [Candidatus Peribacteraceae bacterium]|nr:hypothetical protein [Candidatus Peribacteraceae bacterium]
MQTRPLLFAGVILLGLAGLGVADALLVEEGIPLPVTPPAASSASSSSPANVAIPPTGSEEASSSSATSEAGVRKKTGADVLQVLVQSGFTFEDTQEQTLIGGMVQSRVPVQAKVLIRDGDRAGLLVWIETPEVKTYFRTLKEALHPLFSTEVKDLLDEIQRSPDRPPRNFLT